MTSERALLLSSVLLPFVAGVTGCGGCTPQTAVDTLFAKSVESFCKGPCPPRADVEAEYVRDAIKDWKRDRACMGYEVNQCRNGWSLSYGRVDFCGTSYQFDRKGQLRYASSGCETEAIQYGARRTCDIVFVRKICDETRASLRVESFSLMPGPGSSKPLESTVDGAPLAFDAHPEWALTLGTHLLSIDGSQFELQVGEDAASHRGRVELKSGTALLQDDLGTRGSLCTGDKCKLSVTPLKGPALDYVLRANLVSKP